MTEHVYECMFIFDSNKYARDPGGVSGKIPEMVEKLDGEVLASRLWNEQRLAYQIKGQRKGTYWLTYFRINTDKLTQFNRACKLNETILRNLTLKVDPRLVDTLVSHALGKTKPAEEDEKTAETAVAAKDAPAKDAVADTPVTDTAAEQPAKDTAGESKKKADE